VIRSDASEAHRLSLSARVVSAQNSQVKAKTAVVEALLTHFETKAGSVRTRRVDPHRKPHGEERRFGAASRTMGRAAILRDARKERAPQDEGFATPRKRAAPQNEGFEKHRLRHK
jgi:hypothetical protein